MEMYFSKANLISHIMYQMKAAKIIVQLNPVNKIIKTKSIKINLFVLKVAHIYHSFDENKFIKYILKR